MSPIVSRMVRWMSSSACVVTSPITMHRPLVMAVSQATRAWGSWASIPSRTESETWSQTLSGCPSVTDSEVSRNDADSLKEVVTTAANDTCGGTGDSLAERRRSVDPARVSRKPDRKAGGPSGAVALPAVLGRLTEQLRLQREDVIEDAIDAPALEAMIGDHPGVFQVAAQ